MIGAGFQSRPFFYDPIRPNNPDLLVGGVLAQAKPKAGIVGRAITPVGMTVSLEGGSVGTKERRTRPEHVPACLVDEAQADPVRPLTDFVA